MTRRVGPKLPVLTVEMSKTEYDMLYRFAHRTGASVYEVVMLGTLRLINKINTGECSQDVLNDHPVEQLHS